MKINAKYIWILVIVVILVSFLSYSARSKDLNKNDDSNDTILKVDAEGMILNLTDSTMTIKNLAIIVLIIYYL